jgi:DMSO/TMAO reductase YedYZ molybdopterin-dependent catalytic subunit
MGDALENEEVYSAERTEQLQFDLAREHDLSRRELLKLGALGLPVLAGFARLASPSTARAARADNGAPISKPLPPQWFTNFGSNAEMRWDAVQGLGYEIPNERFFVRDHTGTPIIDPNSWQLKIFGTGLKGSPSLANPITYTYEQLTAALPKKTIYTFIECAGNGRSFFGTQEGTPAAGTQWKLGAVGVAGWTGVPLSAVLDAAGILPTAVDVMPSGLDGTVVASGVNAGHVRRPIPASKALDDVLLAYEMNGRPLPYDHGYPVRLVVPGWVGVANIKWIGQIEVSATPLYSLWNTTQYVLTGPTYASPQPVTNQVVKSAFELAFNAQLPAGQTQTLSGRSWSGSGSIKEVDISVDGGVTWKPATLHGANLPNAWARWNFNWTPPAAGAYTLRARATDSAGNTQPTTVPFNNGGYLFGAIVQHPVVAT